MEASMAVLALVLNLYHEARGEGPEGMRVIADTVYTRVHDDRWPKTYTETILQDKQFAWVEEKSIKEPTDLITLQHRVLHSKSTTPKDLLAYKQATRIAKEVSQKATNQDITSPISIPSHNHIGQLEKEKLE